MKIIVCSDSHGNIANLLALAEKEGPDLLLHLGDTARDAEQLQMRLPQLRMRWVPGNCDGWGTAGPEEICFEEQGKRIFMLHGHTAHVKTGTGFAVRKAQDAGAQLLLFGHTHIPLCRQADGLWVLNPGSIRTGDYGIVFFTEDGMTCKNDALF